MVLCVTITCSPYTEDFADMVMAALMDMDYEGFEYADPCIKAYINAEHYRETHLRVVLDGFRKAGAEVDFSKEVLPDKNWNEAWEKDFDPVVLGPVTIKAPFHKGLPRTRYNIVLSPDMSFGTGHHPTTAMMVEALLSYPVKGKRVMDLGTGTGVLAVLAAKMGAQVPVRAVDNDRRAVGATLANAHRNRVGHKIHVIHGDASAIIMGHYDLIMANINRNILLQEMDTLGRGLVSGGALITSGYYPADEDLLLEKAMACGLSPELRHERDGWAQCLWRKK